jgi:hypothetical protein
MLDADITAIAGSTAVEDNKVPDLEGVNEDDYDALYIRRIGTYCRTTPIPATSNNLVDSLAEGKVLEELFHIPEVIGAPTQFLADIMTRLYPYAGWIVFHVDDVVVLARDGSDLGLTSEANAAVIWWTGRRPGLYMSSLHCVTATIVSSIVMSLVTRHSLDWVDVTL